MKRRIEMISWLVHLSILASLVWTVQQALAKDEILLGSHIPMSGVGSLVGMEQKWAYDMAVGDINKAGGVYGSSIPLI